MGRRRVADHNTDRAEQAGWAPNAGPRACNALIDAGAMLLDVREPEEWQAEHIPMAVPIPMGQVRSRGGRTANDRRIVVVCRSGGRSAVVTELLLASGFDAVNLAGGGWL